MQRAPHLSNEGIRLCLDIRLCPQFPYIGPDSLYCGKFRNISKSHHDHDLDRTMPNVELIRAIFIYYNNVQVSSGLKLYFFSYRVHRQTDRHTDTDGHKYSIVAVDKNSLLLISSEKNCMFKLAAEKKV